MSFGYERLLAHKNNMMGGQPPNGDDCRNIDTLQINVEINCVAFHPHLPMFATGNRHGHTNLWRLNDDSTLAQRTPVDTLVGHSDYVTFHPQLPIVATGSPAGIVKLWRLNDDGTLAEPTSVATVRGRNHEIISIAFHPRLPIFATGGSDNGTAESCSVKLWRLNDDYTLVGQGPISTLIRHTGRVTSIAFHNHLPIIATGSHDRTVNVWHLNDDGSLAQTTPVATLVGHTSLVRCVAFHPLLPIIATGSYDRRLKLWRLNDDGTLLQPTPIDTLNIGSRVICVTFHPWYPMFATTSDELVISHAIKLWRLNDDGTLAQHTPISRLRGHTLFVTSIAFHSRLPIIVTGSDDGTAKLWQCKMLEPPHHLEILRKETDIPENVRSAPCALCNLPLCAQIPDTTYNINGYVVKMTSAHYFHYNCIHRYLTNRQSISELMTCPTCESVIDSDEISRFLHSPDADADAKLCTDFYIP